jgi:hypothetical protein
VIKGLQRRGVNLTVMGSPTDPACWGENRTRLVNRTKILLNLSRSSGQFPDLRFILGMANKSLVISEPIHHPAPYVAGQHFISATFEEMPEVIAYYLAHESERERVANEGHRFVTREVTMIHSVNRILELVRESHELL